MEDKIKITGVLSIKIIDVKTGKIIDVFEDKNLVVNTGLNAVTGFFSGPSTNYIQNIGFGTNNAAATLTDTSLTNQFSKGITSFTNPTNNSVAFNFTLEATENNGVNIAEYGLLLVDGTLFARKVYSPIVTKTTNIRLVGTWTLTIN